MYLSAGDTMRAVEIIGQHGWIDMLMNVVTTIDKADRECLTRCADYLIKHKQYFHAGLREKNHYALAHTPLFCSRSVQENGRRGQTGRDICQIAAMAGGVSEICRYENCTNCAASNSSLRKHTLYPAPIRSRFDVLATNLCGACSFAVSSSRSSTTSCAKRSTFRTRRGSPRTNASLRRSRVRSNRRLDALHF